MEGGNLFSTGGPAKLNDLSLSIVLDRSNTLLKEIALRCKRTATDSLHAGGTCPAAVNAVAVRTTAIILLAHMMCQLKMQYGAALLHLL